MVTEVSEKYFSIHRLISCAQLLPKLASLLLLSSKLACPPRLLKPLECPDLRRLSIKNLVILLRRLSYLGKKLLHKATRATDGHFTGKKDLLREDIPADFVSSLETQLH